MMFPKPLDEADPHSREAELVSAAREHALSEADKEALWSSIAACLPLASPLEPHVRAPSDVPAPTAPAVGGEAASEGGAAAAGQVGAGGAVAPATPGAAASIAGLTLGKGLWVALSVVLVGLAGYAVRTISSSGRVAPAMVESTPAPRFAEATATAAGAAPVAPAVAAPASKETAAFDPSGQAEMPSTKGAASESSIDTKRGASAAAAQSAHEASALREESQNLLEARAALRGGNPSAALDLLSRARTRFPRGALAQEREALTIEALYRSGQKQLASQRADAFLRQFPRSPHAADVRRYLAN